VFPVGQLEKTSVRKLAAQFELPVAQKHESQEICFIPDNDYVKFLEAHGVSKINGEIVTMGGTVVGHHSGTHQFTIGQRKGMGIAWKHPLHVVALDTKLNRVVVGGHEELFQQTLTAGKATWATVPTNSEFRATCKIRYRHTASHCTVTLLPDNRFKVRFDQPQTAITPGQAAVLYDGERVLGGGWIT
jgi:tRNA-specific 2-thiouridylase